MHCVIVLQTLWTLYKPRPNPMTVTNFVIKTTFGRLLRAQAEPSQITKFIMNNIIKDGEFGCVTEGDYLKCVRWPEMVPQSLATPPSFVFLIHRGRVGIVLAWHRQMPARYDTCKHSLTRAHTHTLNYSTKTQCSRQPLHAAQTGAQLICWKDGRGVLVYLTQCSAVTTVLAMLRRLKVNRKWGLHTKMNILGKIQSKHPQSKCHWVKRKWLTLKKTVHS